MPSNRPRSWPWVHRDDPGSRDFQAPCLKPVIASPLVVTLTPQHLALGMYHRPSCCPRIASSLTAPSSLHTLPSCCSCSDITTAQSGHILAGPALCMSSSWSFHYPSSFSFNTPSSGVCPQALDQTRRLSSTLCCIDQHCCYTVIFVTYCLILAVLLRPPGRAASSSHSSVCTQRQRLGLLDGTC